jgi:hypothetical protein
MIEDGAIGGVDSDLSSNQSFDGSGLLRGLGGSGQMKTSAVNAVLYETFAAYA